MTPLQMSLCVGPHWQAPHPAHAAASLVSPPLPPPNAPSQFSRGGQAQTRRGAGARGLRAWRTRGRGGWGRREERVRVCRARSNQRHRRGAMAGLAASPWRFSCRTAKDPQADCAAARGRSACGHCGVVVVHAHPRASPLGLPRPPLQCSPAWAHQCGTQRRRAPHGCRLAREVCAWRGGKGGMWEGAREPGCVEGRKAQRGSRGGPMRQVACEGRVLVARRRGVNDGRLKPSPPADKK